MPCPVKMEKANINLFYEIITIHVLMTKLGFLTTTPLVLHLSFRERRGEERDRPGEKRRGGEEKRGTDRERRVIYCSGFIVIYMYILKILVKLKKFCDFVKMF